MKRILLCICILAGINAAAFGQGSVNPNNGTTTTFRTNYIGNVGNALSAMGPWYYEVLTAPSTVTSVDASLQQLLSAPWSDTGIQATNTGLAGRMGSANTTANFWPAGQTNSFIVVGWSANEGATWAALAPRLQGATFSFGWIGGGFVAGGAVGATTIGFRQAGGVVGGNTIPTPSLFGSGPDAQGQPITTTTDLYVILPEPSVPALAGLGVTAMAIFRRKAKTLIR